MEKIEKALSLEEVESQIAELLPDRIEMRRRSRIRKKKRGFECSPSNTQIGTNNNVNQDNQCFKVS
jgi:tRNA(Ser,Leu) C12 N-acetylase TAN1